MAESAVTEKNSPLYTFGRSFGWLLLRVLMPVKYHGFEKLHERKGPFVLIANHRHALDPVVLAYPVREQCVFLGKKELAKNSFFRRVLTSLHCILVDRHNADMTAMRMCMKAVKTKRILVIFPEGTRHHEGQMEQIENGTALIALRSKVPIIPVYFDRKLKLFRRTHMYVGNPIPYDDLLAEGINAETCERMNDRFREVYREMVRTYGDNG